jgi:hypothetical protein
MVYRGAAILVFPGIKVPSTSRPSGGVTRVPIVKAAGINRIASLMKPLRWGKVAKVLISCGSTLRTSSYIFSACSGYLAKKYQRRMRLGPVVSLN